MLFLHRTHLPYIEIILSVANNKKYFLINIVFGWILAYAFLAVLIWYKRKSESMKFEPNGSYHNSKTSNFCSVFSEILFFHFFIILFKFRICLFLFCWNSVLYAVVLVVVVIADSNQQENIIYKYCTKRFELLLSIFKRKERAYRRGGIWHNLICRTAHIQLIYDNKHSGGFKTNMKEKKKEN